MSKLPARHRFLDLSDYGRPLALGLVRALHRTRVTSIHLTLAFFVAGGASIACILTGQYIAAAVLLMVKNVLDAADGEMARVRQRPSHTGRYLDSVCDYVINGGVIVALGVVTQASWLLIVIAFFAIELQGTIYNYYYLNQRRLLGGDMTSSINEFEPPTPFPYEHAPTVAVLHRLYLLCYGPFDQLMLAVEGDRTISESLPNSFMTAISSMGLGFQLLVISLALVLGWPAFVLPFFSVYLGVGMLLILVRKGARLGQPTSPCPDQV